MAVDRPGNEQDAPPEGARPIERPQPTPLYAWLSRRLLRAEAWARSRGSRRVRRATAAIWVIVALIGAILLVGPVINKPATLEDITTAASEVTSDWIARSFDAEYTISRDDEGRMQVEVVETIDALFPDGVEPEPIARVISSQYEGHDLQPTLTAATVDGAAVTPGIVTRPTTTTFVVPVGDTGTREYTVVLTYTLSDVAYRAYDDSTRLTDDLLEWDVLGGGWAQGIAEKSLSITLPRDLDDAMTRQPTASLAWLLIGDTQTLEPDSETAASVTYVVTNDQNMPPYSQFWFTMHFADGTFTMPPESWIYWVQVIGPFAPLILLGVALLFALAARAVAWSDARGRAWFVSQYAPEPDVSVPLAARLWRAPLAAPLMRALEEYRRHPKTGSARRGLVREARRFNRVGNIPLAWGRYLGAAEWAEQFRRGLRRVPRGFVRDMFIGASLALTLVQWGLVRQLSYQFSLTEYWWPVVIVFASSALAAVVLVIALSARPLTRPGVFAREHLMGLELYLEQTQAIERTTLRDPLLPYIVMFAPRRRAKRTVARLIKENGLAREVSHDPQFLTAGRLAVRGMSVLALVAAIAVAIWVPASTTYRDEDAVYSGDLPGDYGMFVHTFDAQAMADVASDSSVSITVTETLEVNVGSGFREVPQVLRQWQDRVDGHDTGLTVTGVTVDGADVPYTQSRMQGQALLQTQIPDEWPGEHTVVINYRIADAVGTTVDGGERRDQVRWAALNPGWSFAWSGVDDDVERVRAQLTVPTALADAMIGDSGPLDYTLYNDDGVRVREFDTVRTAGDQVVFTEERATEEDHDWLDDNTFLGFQMQFVSGTFTGGGIVEWFGFAFIDTMPVWLPLTLGIGAIGFAALGVLIQRVRPAAVAQSGLLRDSIRWIPPWFTAAQVVTLFWATLTQQGDEPEFMLAMTLLVVSIVASIVVLISTRRRNPQRSR
ncbi:DUF2207 domain-containing protein [Microbacterium sp. C7(2022)]|uniref:DUF2207 domain-containing protein n=1 Tax=Microbacterium sp. C7(2022) TaxID=2992759 RepID=UPI00237AC178|nr:DUF2207 domain-containing protein [Microbacterium sp. C7(2022)]MDE0546667.1 DUF2207 domain-containing protein [Microbacterium sp. C7(2022)]